MLLFILGGFLLLSSIDLVKVEPKIISVETRRMSRNALHKRDAGAVSIPDYFNLLYYVNATAGTPGRNIAFGINTDSPDA
jgi:hypothetical protein